MYWIIIIRNSEKSQCWHYLEAPAVLITYNRYKIHLEVGGRHFLERPPLPPGTWGFSEIFFSSPSLFQHHRYLFTHIDYLCCYSSHHWGNCRCCCTALERIDPRSLATKLNEMFWGGAEWKRNFHRHSGSQNDFNYCDHSSLFRILFWDPELFLSQPLNASF